ncbi:hypothetical protein JB92DRAFT_2864403 [Gautieria morchelliformis]|nr:hypothetical protein JB92DRAFT_2864403 [Gautieria morchelliformis]
MFELNGVYIWNIVLIPHSIFYSKYTHVHSTTYSKYTHRSFNILFQIYLTMVTPEEVPCVSSLLYRLDVVWSTSISHFTPLFPETQKVHTFDSIW